MKIRVIALILILCLMLAGCGGKQEENNGSGDASSSGNQVTQADSYAPIEQGSGLVPESDVVDASYFDDAAFIGDSVSLKLSYYQASTKALGDAVFFTAGSLSAANALWDISDESVHPSYQGAKTLVEDCVKLCGAKKVYIMLGMNDIGLYGLEDSIKNYVELIDRIVEKNPGVVIFVQSMTPMTATSPRASKGLNNTVIKEYNGMLLDMCNENGWYYLDVSSVFYDSTGEALKDSYCSDIEVMGIHFTAEGCEKWVEYLKCHAIGAENYPVSTPEAVG